MSVVLDASALLAYLQDEPGAERVRAALANAVMSTVNWAEVVGKARDDGSIPGGCARISRPSDSRSNRSRPSRPRLQDRSRNVPGDTVSRSAIVRVSRSGAIGANRSARRTVSGSNWTSVSRSRRSGSRRRVAVPRGGGSDQAPVMPASQTTSLGTDAGSSLRASTGARSTAWSCCADRRGRRSPGYLQSTDPPANSAMCSTMIGCSESGWL